MFKLQPNPTFKAKVKIPVPGSDVGEITVIFNHKKKKDLVEFFTSLTSDKERTDIDVLSEIVAGWEGVDEKFSKENLEALIDNFHGAALALLSSYRVELVEAQAKN